MAERCDESIGLGYEDGLSCILDMGHDGAHIDDYPWSMHIRWELIPKPDQIVVHETTEQEPSMPVIAEFEHIWPYVNGRHEPCVRCGKPYGPNAGSCTVIISTTGPTDPSSGVS